MKILVLQHLAVEHPGSFRDLWAEAGHEWLAVELDAGERIPPLGGFDLMVSMGGPMDVWQTDRHPWIAEELAAIRTWVCDMGRPFLGICLGHQMLAEALGGRVALMDAPEVGLAPVDLTPDGRADPLFSGFGRALETFQWHGAAITALPDGATVLAANPACPTQAIRWGRHAYGLQFHVEITPTTVADWQAIPEYAASLQSALGQEGAATLSERLAPRLPDFAGTARRLHDNLGRIATPLASLR
ncbi:type 1 glutamine amidotransferase [Cereibacter sphaeroides]|uniref:type 1 glutamine amidotransferase n=1 Tax=Cereibacter sphaeroides TaxID=1063 RepID=UPI00313D810C